MRFYAQIGVNGKVHTVSETDNLMVKVQTADNRLIGTTYDEAIGQFIGLKTVLTVDKPSILANGVDTATITATVYNWDDTPATSYTGSIVFDVNGLQQTVAAANGIATLPVTASYPDSYVIKTVNADFLSNGSVTVAAVGV